jgi:DNA-binding transcriptional regulator YdaS (Cro superfamily)
VRQHENAYARVLARAAVVAGSIEALALELHISPAIVRAWVNGTQKVPVAVFLTVVDLLMDK